MSEKDGGHAFPSSGHLGNEGMTLRDYFAGRFLSTMQIPAPGMDADEVARSCYVMADAMLHARKAT